MKQVIAVTGLSGMMGSRFEQLYGNSYQLVNVDLTEGIDITNGEQLLDYLKSSQVDSVIHLAGFTNVSAAHEQYGDEDGVCYQVNVVGTRNVAQACRDLGLQLIHISTDYVFDGDKKSAYTEEDDPNPIEWYGQTKYMSEKEVEENLENYVILRTAYPYQARPVRPDMVSQIRTKLQDGTLPPVFTDHMITPTYTDDLCQVFDMCLEQKPRGIYHAVGSSWHTDFEIATKVKQTFDLHGKIQRGSLTEYQKTTSRPYQKSMKMSNAKLKKDLGIKMKSFDDGLEEISRQMA